MKLNLDTIILYVQNVDRLKAFYTEIFELEIIEEYQSEWLLLSAGRCKIGLHKIGENYLDKIETGHKFDNNTKIVFEIEDDINTVRKFLVKQNVLMREVKTFDNYEYLLCDGEDPEGNILQLKQKKKSIDPNF